MRRAVFLDRDGVLNAALVRDGCPHPPESAAQLELLPGVRERLSELKALGFALICVTNQPDVARGTVTREAVDRINARVRTEMGLDDLLACFHDERDRCDCRKPRPGLLQQAAARLGVDLGRSYMIGDRWKDIACGAAVGCTTVFVDHGYAEAYQGPAPAHTSRSAADALEFILSKERSSADEVH